MSTRVDTFRGTNREYISYLEEQVLTLRQRLKVSPCPDATTRSTDNAVWAAEETGPVQRQQQPYSDAFAEAMDIPDERAAKRTRKHEPRWMQNAKALIAQTPTAVSWSESLRTQGIHDIMTSGDAVICLLDSKLELRLPAKLTVPEGTQVEADSSDTLTYLRDYAQTTAMRGTLASTALALANFQKFLVLSACGVLMEGETPIASVLDIVRICVGENSSDEHCRRTVTAAKYLNVLVDRLNIHGWGSRASELLLLCTFTVFLRELH